MPDDPAAMNVGDDVAPTEVADVVAVAASEPTELAGIAEADTAASEAWSLCPDEPEPRRVRTWVITGAALVASLVATIVAAPPAAPAQPRWNLPPADVAFLNLMERQGWTISDPMLISQHAHETCAMLRSGQPIWLVHQKQVSHLGMSIQEAQSLTEITMAVYANCP